MVNKYYFIFFYILIENSYFELMFQNKNSINETIVESIKTKKSKLNSEKRLSFSDSKIIFNNINIDEDIIDIFLLYNGEIVKSLKTDTKNYYRLVSSQIGLSKEFQNIIFEIVNKIELTIQIKFSNNSSTKKEISFKSRLKMYNKNAENQKKEINTKNHKEVKEEKKETVINNDHNEKKKKYKLKEKNVINEEEEHNYKDKDDEKDNSTFKKKNNDMNKENFKTLRKKISFFAKDDEEIFKKFNEQEEKMKELELIIKNKDEQIKKLSNNKKISENISKPIWDEIIKEEKENNFAINGIIYEEYEIINMLNKTRKPFIINKENEIELIEKNNKKIEKLVSQNINGINLFGKEETEIIKTETKKVSYEFYEGDKFFIIGHYNERIINEDNYITNNKASSEICFSDKFTIQQNKQKIFINLIKENNNSIQLFSTKKEKEQLEISNSYKFNIQSLFSPKLDKEQKDSIQLSSIIKEPLKLFKSEKFIIQGIKLKENSLVQKLQNEKKDLQLMHANEIIIKDTHNVINQIQLVNQLEIQKIEKEDKKGKWITEKDKNNILIIEGIKKPLNSILSNDKIELDGKINNENKSKNDFRRKQKNDVVPNFEENDIKMTVNYKDNSIFNYEKVKMDEKNVENNNKGCDGCFIY